MEIWIRMFTSVGGGRTRARESEREGRGVNSCSGNSFPTHHGQFPNEREREREREHPVRPDSRVPSQGGSRVPMAMRCIVIEYRFVTLGICTLAASSSSGFDIFCLFIK